jgi:hypothetical protein
MRILLDFIELESVGNGKVMTLTSYCTCIRVEVTGKHKEEVQQRTDFKVRAIRDTLTVAQLFQKLTTTTSAEIIHCASHSLHVKCCRLAHHKEK